MLRNACEDLREEFDLLSTERMNIANKNFLPKYADARENPSRKVLIFFLSSDWDWDWDWKLRIENRELKQSQC